MVIRVAFEGFAPVGTLCCFSSSCGGARRWHHNRPSGSEWF